MNVFLVNNIYNNYLSFAKAMVRDCGGDPRVVELPLKVKGIFTFHNSSASNPPKNKTKKKLKNFIQYNAIYGAINSGTAEYMQPVQILL